MGRKKIEQDKKVQTVSVYIPESVYKEFQEKDIKNKSKFFAWLLEQHFDETNKK